MLSSRGGRISKVTVTVSGSEGNLPVAVSFWPVGVGVGVGVGSVGAVEGGCVFFRFFFGRFIGGRLCFVTFFTVIFRMGYK